VTDASSQPTEAPQGREPDGRAPRPGLGDRIVRWGALATALTAIIGLGVLVLNLARSDPAPSRGGTFERVDIRPGVAFGEFKSSQEFATAPGRRAYLAVAGDLMAQEELTPEQEQAPPGATPTATPTATPSPTATPEPPADPLAGGAEVIPSDDPSEILLRSADEPTQTSTVELPEDCRRVGSGSVACDSQLPVSWADPGEDAPAGEQAVVSAEEFLRVLAATRRRTVDVGGERVTEPIGVTVSMKAVIEGYRGERVELRWSLHRARQGEPVPQEWLVNRRVLSREMDSDRQSVSADFWVPLPRERARSYIRVVLYDEDREQIDSEETRRFR
jgi:hypothetical protein